MSSHDPDLLDRAIRRVYLDRANLDAVMVSGDLATTGETADLQAAAVHVMSPAVAGSHRDATGRATLQSVQREIILFPGNHDRYKGRFYAPNGREFDRLLGKLWNPVKEIQTVTLELSGQRLAIVCADFCLRSTLDATGLPGMLGQGKASDSTVADLVNETLAQRNQRGAGVIWAVHFPPAFPGINSALSLLDDVNLIDAANRVGVSSIICGHTHEALQYAAAGDPPVDIFCAGTACQYFARNGNVIHIYEIEADGTSLGRVSRTDLVWNQRRGDFV